MKQLDAIRNWYNGAQLQAEIMGGWENVMTLNEWIEHPPMIKTRIPDALLQCKEFRIKPEPECVLVGAPQGQIDDLIDKNQALTIRLKQALDNFSELQKLVTVKDEQILTLKRYLDDVYEVTRRASKVTPEYYENIRSTTPSP